MKKQLVLILLFLYSCSGACSESPKASVFADFLYWHASEETSSIWANVLLDHITLIPPSFGVNPSRAPNIYFGWDPGFRIGVQYDLTEFFDTKVYWTHFSTVDHEAITANPGEVIYSQFFNGFSTLTGFNAAQVDWQLTMDMIDIEAGHYIDLLETFSLKPFIGIKGGTINQGIESKWSENATFLFIPFNFDATENLKNNFYGIGPSFGLDSVWKLYKQLMLRGDFSTALMWGHWTIQDIYSGPSFELGLAPTTISTVTNNDLGTLMFRYFTGLEWTHTTQNSITLRAGYEVQYWTNQLRLPTFQQLPVHGNLTLQGATCGISIKFG